MTAALENLERYLRDHEADYASEHLLLRELAYKRLYDAFRNVELEPGESLSTVWLSKLLGISRTPVREALQQLATDGLIQIIQGRPVAAVARSPQEVFDALHVRELLEPASVRLCASGIADRDRERLARLMDAMEQAACDGDRATWSRADMQWHEVLCEACPNPLLGQMVLLARNRMYHRGSDEHVPAQYLKDGTLEHRRILEAIIAHEEERAASLMQDHLEQLKQNLLKRFIR
ncbi:MAG: GntR family transcriptional regulator [Anaerolineae bacterium]|nr:GntR family transcriptional regulator [Anaerolineae bacterium]